MKISQELKKRIISFFPMANYWRRLFLGKEYRFVSLDYLLMKSDNVRILKREKNTYYYSSMNEKEGVLIKGDAIDNYVVKLKDAVCCAGSDTILIETRSGKKVLYNEYKNIKRIRKITNCSEPYVLEKDTRYWHKTVFPSETCSLKEGILISGTFSFNYYHFMFAILPKLLTCELINPQVPILVDENVQRYPSYNRLVELCNIQGRPVLQIKSDIKYKIAAVYLISSPLFLPLNLFKGCVPQQDTTQYDIAVLRRLRDRLIIEKDGSSDYPQRIFISRKKASGRRMFNEDDCYEAIKHFGFEKVFPEDYSLSQQIALFNHAEVIVGGSGAAFANLIFCAAGCKIVVLNGYRMPLSLWTTLAYMNGASLYEVIDISKGVFSKDCAADGFQNDFHIDKNELMAIVSSIL